MILHSFAVLIKGRSRALNQVLFKKMSDRCCVPGCKWNYALEEYTTVFHFPHNDQIKQKWLRNIHRDNFVPTKYSVVCIKHFEENFIMRERKAEKKDGSVLALARDRVKLIADAVPSIFSNQPNKLLLEEQIQNKD